MAIVIADVHQRQTTSGPSGEQYQTSLQYPQKPDLWSSLSLRLDPTWHVPCLPSGNGPGACVAFRYFWWEHTAPFGSMYQEP